ncbi:MAG: hypothetical protein QXN87_09155 [Candidatus Bathyarchaeia archaeon]
MNVLSAERAARLSLGVPIVDEVYPGFEPGDFGVLYGDEASTWTFLLCVRSIMPPASRGLGSPVVFVDGGNSFNPYLVADFARRYGFEPCGVLKKIYVSRAFTAYQLYSLIMERLEPFLESVNARLLVVSEVASLFLDRDMPKTEAEELFVKVCSKLSDIASKKKTVVLATYHSDGRSRRSLFLEAVLFGRCNVLIKFERKGRLLRLALQDHPHIKPFTLDLTLDNSLTKYLEV